RARERPLELAEGLLRRHILSSRHGAAACRPTSVAWPHQNRTRPGGDDLTRMGHVRRTADGRRRRRPVPRRGSRAPVRHQIRALRSDLVRTAGGSGRMGVAIELSERWVSLAEPLRALMADVEREAHADMTMPPDLAAVSARWARVSDAIRATVHTRIA